MNFQNSKFKTFGLAVSFIISSSFAGSSWAQSMTQEQIDQMAAMMRSQGQSEAQVQKFIEQMKSVQKFSQELEAGKADGMNEMQAARKAAGFSDQQIADMDEQDQNIASMEQRSRDIALQRKQNEFDQKYASHPDANITFDGTAYTLKVTECAIRDELFNIRAKGRPTGKILEFKASKSSGYGQGGYIEGLGLRVGELDFGVSQTAGTLDGKSFSFSGSGKTTNIDTGEKSKSTIAINLTCP